MVSSRDSSLNQRITEVNITALPASAHFPGISPMAKNTQRGLRIGSITGMRLASRAVTPFMAIE